MSKVAIAQNGKASREKYHFFSLYTMLSIELYIITRKHLRNANRMKNAAKLHFLIQIR